MSDEVKNVKPVRLDLRDQGTSGLEARFAASAPLILRDLNDFYSYYGYKHGFFGKYKKDDIAKFLRYPAKYERQLRRAILYIYGASPHFRRLISYFTGLSDFAYIISPYKIDPTTAKPNVVKRNYRKVLSTLSDMNVHSQFPKILTVCLREDVFYGTMHETNGAIMIQQLPSDYCEITEIVDNVPNVTFDFQYFDTHHNVLEFYPEEFRRKYDIYKNSQRSKRFQTLDSPTSFAIKCSNDILEYALPPFAGILREVFELEDYKVLKLSKTALENYAMLSMKLEMDDEGNWLLDYDKAVDFWRNLDSILPEEVGSVLTPMDIDKISFEKSNTGDTDTIADAEQNLFTAAGVSSLLFNNPKASATALLLSIKADQALVYGIVKSIEDMVNRYIRSKSYGRYFKVTILDCSPFNRKELGDQYIKAIQYGLPLISAYAATQGLAQNELDDMSFLENDVLHLPDVFHPLQSSSTMSSNGDGKDSSPGRPREDDEDLTDAGEQSRERE